ncbi:SMAD/FHA domain-containing protein, partial [Atractiella rhizophila]
MYQHQPPSSLQSHHPSTTTNSNSRSIYPSLHLTPINDSFVPKQISLSPPGTRVRIGRQTNAKTAPNDRNGYFESKVLSRMHAEVWYEGGKVFIKDVKSANGTFINGTRLSTEGVESQPWELHTDDMVEFGIDIMSEDNKMIVHHKVSAKVFLVLNAEDAVASSRYANHLRKSSPLHRRGKAGGSVGLNFDQLFSHLQNEIQKSKETTNELNVVTNIMGSIHETINGGQSVPPPISPKQIPPFSPRAPPMLPAAKDYGSTITALQNQLSETQASLTSHTERMGNLESLLAEHESLKREMSEMKEVMEDSKRGME